MARSADYRLVWREEATHPQGTAAFGIDVQPRVTFRLATSRVARKKGLVVKGSIYPKRPAAIQMKTSDGWQTIRKLKPTRQRFQVTVSTGRIDPGTHRLRLWVPRDAQRKFANVASRQRGVLVFDRFIVRCCSSAHPPPTGRRSPGCSASRSAPSPPCWPRAGRRGSRS
jgi:hypothetical protein